MSDTAVLAESRPVVPGVLKLMIKQGSGDPRGSLIR